jgi:hypothetical protein
MALRYFEEMKDRPNEIITASVLLSFLGLLVVGIFLDILYSKYFWISMALVEAVNQITRKTFYVESGKSLVVP